VTPEYDRTICLRFNVPTEQLRTVPRLKPNLFKRQPTAGFPILILPGLWVIDEELIEQAHDCTKIEAAIL
jgi:hypothetical protein